MRRRTAVLSRAVLALALATSWLVAAGLPAGAEVSGWGVQNPSNGAVLDRATELVVYVDRTASPEDEEVEVRTRMLDSSDQPISEKVISLKFKRRVENAAGGDQLIYGGTIDPYALVWRDDEGIAPNGTYDLQLQIVVRNGDVERVGEWDDHALVFDATPLPPGQAQVKVADRAAKRMEVSWDPSATPDLMHYDVERRVDGGPWEIAQTGVAPEVTSVTDTVASFGSYRYRVTAVRPSADGSGEVRTTTGDASWTTELAAPRKPARRGAVDAEPSPRPTRAPRVTAPPVQRPSFDIPIDANQTYKGPLDYGVKPRTVTERVPVEIAEGGAAQDAQDEGVLKVLTRSVDAERVLPAVAGGLILVLSAAHVLRYLNE